MSKKAVILCVCAVVLLLAGIGVGLLVLYPDGGKKSSAVQSSELPALLEAIPSDVAALFCFRDMRKGFGAVSDRSNMLRSLIGDNAAFSKFISTGRDSLSLKSRPMALAVYYSGSLSPLLLLDGGHARDTSSFVRSVTGYAASLGLYATLSELGERNLLVISPSETVANASVRNVAAGTSVLDDPAFAAIAGKCSAGDWLFVSHNYLDKIASVLCLRPALKAASFLRSAARWSSLEIREGGMLLSGMSETGGSPACYFNMASELPDGELRSARAVPASCEALTAVAVPDLGSYLKSRARYLDARQALQSYQRDCDTLRSRTGVHPEAWFESLGVREVAKATLRPEDGKLRKVVLIRAARHSAAKEGPCAYGAFPVMVFGDAFALDGDCVCRVSGEWVLLGLPEDLDAFALAMDSEGALAETVRPAGFSTKSVFCAVYCSPSSTSPAVKEWLRPYAASVARVALENANDGCLVASCSKAGVSVEIVRAEAVKKDGKAVSGGKIAEVEVPKGPFEVYNSGTQKQNLFYQAPNYSLCLKDKESGKGLWGVSFDKPICGAVECIDYFNNGKIQFLFAAGSSLYLIDRLGRFVGGFPVDLGKEVRLGPAVYDFTGAKGYTALVLHRDNSLGMYNLHGVAPEEWKGINCTDTILGLPALGRMDGKRVWVVETAGGQLVYGFWGGAPLKVKNIKNIEYQ